MGRVGVGEKGEKKKGEEGEGDGEGGRGWGQMSQPNQSCPGRRGRALSKTRFRLKTARYAYQ